MKFNGLLRFAFYIKRKRTRMDIYQQKNFADHFKNQGGFIKRKAFFCFLFSDTIFAKSFDVYTIKLRIFFSEMSRSTISKGNPRYFKDAFTKRRTIFSDYFDRFFLQKTVDI